MAVHTGLSHKDTTFTKLFVGGLPYHTTDSTLKAHFDQFGGIEEAVVITDRVTNKSKGYGFVTMADQESAKKAIADPNPVIDGRKANVNLAYLGAKPRGVQADLSGYFSAALNPSYLKPGLIAPQVGLNPFYMHGLMAGAGGLPISQLQLLQSQAQLSPSAAQYQTLADLAAYGYAPLSGLEFPTSPTSLTGYPGLTPGLTYSFPQGAAAQLQFQAQLQQADARLQ